MRTFLAQTARNAWSGLWDDMERLTPEAGPIRARLRAPLTAGELGGLLLCACIVAFFLLAPMPEQEFLYDYRIYIGTLEGQFTSYYYGYWILPLFELPGRLPYPLGYPLGEPGNAPLQRRVLEALLALLCRADVPLVEQMAD